MRVMLAGIGEEGGSLLAPADPRMLIGIRGSGPGALLADACDAHRYSGCAGIRGSGPGALLADAHDAHRCLGCGQGAS